MDNYIEYKKIIGIRRALNQRCRRRWRRRIVRKNEALEAVSKVFKKSLAVDFRFESLATAAVYLLNMKDWCIKFEFKIFGVFFFFSPINNRYFHYSQIYGFLISSKVAFIFQITSNLCHGCATSILAYINVLIGLSSSLHIFVFIISLYSSGKAQNFLIFTQADTPRYKTEGYNKNLSLHSISAENYLIKIR